MTGTLTMVNPGDPGHGVLPMWQSLCHGKRPDGAWRQLRQRRRFRTRKEAERWHAQRVTLANDGKLESATDVREREKKHREQQRVESLISIIDQWFERHKPTLSGTTRLRYAGLVKLLRPLVGNQNVRTFTLRDAVALFTAFAVRGGKRGGPQSGSSVRQARTIIHSALDEAVAFKIVETNVTTGMKLSVAKSAERKPPSLSDVARLLDAAVHAESDLTIPIVLASSCGLRRGEALALTWACVNLDEGWLDVKAGTEECNAEIRLKTPKTASSRRRVGIPSSTSDLLRQHRKRQREWAFKCGPGYDRSSDLVCASPSGGIWRPSNFTTAFIAFARGLAVATTFHDLRHHHATELVAAGVDAGTVSRRLGHSSVAFTLSRYCHASTDADRRATDAMERLLRGPGPAAPKEATS